MRVLGANFTLSNYILGQRYSTIILDIIETWSRESLVKGNEGPENRSSGEWRNVNRKAFKTTANYAHQGFYSSSIQSGRSQINVMYCLFASSARRFYVLRHCLQSGRPTWTNQNANIHKDRGAKTDQRPILTSTTGCVLLSIASYFCQ